MVSGLLLDIDGTLLDAGRPIPGAVEAVAALAAAGVPRLYATNTSRMSGADVARALRDAGFPVRDDEVLTAVRAAAARLAADGVRRVQLLLSPSARAEFAGFTVVEDDPEAVVVGDLGDAFGADVLNAAFRSVRDGARLVATQKNRSWKSTSGWCLDAGAWVAALEWGAEVEAELTGKPAEGFFRMAARILGEPAERVAMVGDDVEVDVAGGRAAGLHGWLVRTGKFDAAKLAAAPPHRAPQHVLDSVCDLPAVLGLPRSPR